MLATKPGPVNSEKLWNEARAAWANVLDTSDVDAATLGFDFESPAPTATQVQALVNAHDPSPLPPRPLDADGQRLYDYMPLSGSASAASISAYIQNTANPAELRLTMATVRSLIRTLWRERQT